MVFTVLRELGRGGFGIVEEVCDEDGEIYAQKTLIIPPQLDATSVKRRFSREVRYQSAIIHENVVKIISYDLTDDVPWFTMPLAICSLHDEMVVDPTIGGNIQTALFQILAGLEEIHRRGFCHRDLKPGNVLKFSDAGNNVCYALSDFGLMAVGENASTTITGTGAGGGTPLYQAPECAINFRRANAKSDIYSFGAILHDVFSSNSRRIPHESLTVPGPLGPIVTKCTERHLHRRYKNVEELRDALFNALSTYTFTFQSGEEQIVVGLLTDTAVGPTIEQWDRIFDFLDSNSPTSQPVQNVFRALRRESIEHLGENDPDLLGAIGNIFASHCRQLSFDFDYCDVLAAKAQLFYDFGDIGLKADIAIAMLCLGTSHNRWFVERKFVEMAGVSVSESVAQRMIVEIDILEINFKNYFEYLQSSIRVNNNQIHPVLQKLLN